MKLYNAPTPNGARVTIFIAEKGIEIPVEKIDIRNGGTRTEAFLQKNSLGQIPVLALDDGRYLAESIAICRYLEGRFPTPALFGADGEAQAFVEMWARRMELLFFNTMADVALHEFEIFKGRVEQMPDYAAARRRDFGKKLSWLDDALSDGRSFVAGEDFSIADIIGMSMLMIVGFADYVIADDLEYVQAWAARLRARPTFP